MTTATDVYGLGLRGSRVWLEGSHVSELPVHDWTRERLAGDQTLLARCLGATLDIGCGPGPVSYTHLDVYKRQVHHSVINR